MFKTLRIQQADTYNNYFVADHTLRNHKIKVRFGSVFQETFVLLQEQPKRKPGAT